MAHDTFDETQAGQRRSTGPVLMTFTVLLDAVAVIVALFAFLLVLSQSETSRDFAFSSWVPALLVVSVLVACAALLTVRAARGRWPSPVVSVGVLAGTVGLVMAAFFAVGAVGQDQGSTDRVAGAEACSAQDVEVLNEIMDALWVADTNTGSPPATSADGRSDGTCVSFYGSSDPAAAERALTEAMAATGWALVDQGGDTSVYVRNGDEVEVVITEVEQEMTEITIAVQPS